MSGANPTQPSSDEYAAQWAEYYKQQAAAGVTTAPDVGAAATAATAAAGPAPAQENGDPAEKKEAEDEALWTRLQAHPEEFDTWVKLVKKVEAMDDLPKIRRSLSSLLTEYPLCFGYWKRLSSHERRHGDPEQATKVLEQGVAATPRSHQLWTYYCQEMRANSTDAAETRKLFERGVTAVGFDWASHHFWDQYIEFEQEQAKLAEGGPSSERVLVLYLRILSYPNQMLDDYFEKFQTLAMARPAPELEASLNTIKALQDPEGQQGEVAERIIPDRSELMKEAITLYNKTKELRDQIKPFEDAVKRPYFHVKQLETTELENWQAYLKWATTSTGATEQTGEGILQPKAGEKWTKPLPYARVINLFERCLVACANYPEMWRLHITFLEDYDIEQARSVYTEATSQFLKRKVEMHLEFATFEERHGNPSGARDILTKAMEGHGSSLEVAIGFANFERRQSTEGDISGVCSVYDRALETFLGKGNAGLERLAFLSIHYARFLARNGDLAKAREVYNKAIETIGGSTAEPSQTGGVLVLAAAALEAAQMGDIEAAVSAVYESAVGPDPKLKLTDASAAVVWEHYITFMEDHGLRSVATVSTLKARYHAVQVAKPTRKRKAPDAAEGANKAAKTAAGAQASAQQQYYGAPQYGQYAQQAAAYGQFDPHAAAAYTQQQQQWYGQQQQY